MTATAITLNVWIVDQEPSISAGLARALKQTPLSIEDLDETVEFNTSTFSSGEDLLVAMDGDRMVDILLLGNELPGIEGVGLLKALRERKSVALVIMITDYATLEKAVRATQLGAYDFLIKPFTPNELKYSIRKAARNIILTRRAEELEKQKQQVRFEFISVLAHELKSPLNAIEGYTELIKTKQIGDTVDPYLPMIDRIETRLAGMRKLIIDLLDMTSIESGRRERDLHSINLVEVVRDVIENNKELAMRNDVSVNYEAKGPVLFDSDRGEVDMLVNNFVSNAIKYNRTGGSATVRLAEAADGVTLTFIDTGIGMTEDEQKKLFKEFSRIKNKNTRRIEGSGLGLSIINKILKLYNGTVDVHSIPDEGTTFTVTLYKTSS